MMTEGRGQGWRKGELTRLPCEAEDCDLVSNAKGLCSRHYGAARYRDGVVPKRARRVKLLRPPPPPREEKVRKPRGRDYDLVPTSLGRGSPSPFKDFGSKPKPPPDGFLSGSVRVRSELSMRSTNGFILHDPECKLVDLVFARTVDVWSHPEVGEYVVDKSTFGRVRVRACKRCDLTAVVQ